MLTVAVREHHESEDDREEYTAEVTINGDCLFARSCHNTGETNQKGETKYCVDDGSTIWHNREDGAAELAKKLLDTIQCPDVEARRKAR